MPTGTVKITRKGQVTIPKKVREKLNANSVYFELKDDVVVMKPVRDAAASLCDYAGNVRHGVSMKKMREKAWEVAAREKAAKRSPRH